MFGPLVNVGLTLVRIWPTWANISYTWLKLGPNRPENASRSNCSAIVGQLFGNFWGKRRAGRDRRGEVSAARGERKLSAASGLLCYLCHSRRSRGAAITMRSAPLESSAERRVRPGASRSQMQGPSMISLPNGRPGLGCERKPPGTLSIGLLATHRRRRRQLSPERAHALRSEAPKDMSRSETPKDPRS